jgi:hypothetical protein
VSLGAAAFASRAIPFLGLKQRKIESLFHAEFPALNEITGTRYFPLPGH